MSITLEINPYSNVIVAPSRKTLQSGYTFTDWTTDTGANMTTDTSENFRFLQDSTTFPLELEIRPYSNLIVAPEKR